MDRAPASESWLLLRMSTVVRSYDLGSYTSVFLPELTTVELAAVQPRWKGFTDIEIILFTDSHADF